MPRGHARHATRSHVPCAAVSARAAGRRGRSRDSIASAPAPSMNIGGKERLATRMGLAAISIIAAMIWWTYSEMENANRQCRVSNEIARGLAELGRATFDYSLHHDERARAQWGAESERVERLVANALFAQPAQTEILAGMREKRAAVQRTFAELTAARGADRADAPLGEAGRRLETQLLVQLLSYQQENFADAYRLNELATERIIDAQRRLMIVILAALALMALLMLGTSWFLRRGVLARIAALQRATHEVAAGNWDFILGVRGGDEISELSQNFDTMTRSLRESFAQVERNNQELAALNEELKAFSYSVSHDLREPLRSIDGFSLVMIEDYGDKLGKTGKDTLERIRSAGQRMGELIDDLLRLSQVTRAELNITRVDLSAIAREIAVGIMHRQPFGRIVEWAIEPGLSVRADPALMRIAMQNLLQNAWKFTGRTDRPVIRVGTLRRGAKTVYFVADNGVGFDMARADKLFGAFQRLHHAGDFPGTGIGLAIVQRIIRRHEGEIWAEAKEGVGATFFFDVKESEPGSDEQHHPAG